MQRKKNLIIIMADQLRKDYLGCYGNPYVKTPHIDSIAKNGCQFENCFVNNPICMPNRMSIFTGQYPHNHGMWTNGLMLEHESSTIGNLLADQGYKTCTIGKMHFEPTDCGLDAPRGSMVDHRLWEAVGDNIEWYGPHWGFEHVELTSGHATQPLAHYGKWYHEHGGSDDASKSRKTAEFDSCPVTMIPEELHDSIFVGERSAAYIKEHADGENPFFLVASFPDPHHPFNPPYETACRYTDAPVKIPVNEHDMLLNRPEHYRQHKQGIWHRAGVIRELESMDENQRIQVRKNLEMVKEFMDEEILKGLGLLTGGSSVNDQVALSINERDRNQRIRNSYAMIELIDKGVGRILSALDEAGILEDTVIVVTSDHGELMGDHGLWYKGPFYYDGLIKTPLIINAPGIDAMNIQALASSVDIYPTCCELLGIDIPRTCEGFSLVPAINGGKARESCLIEYRNGYFEHDVYSLAYIDETYKFVQYQNGECEMTDRIGDPDENNNLLHGGMNEKLATEYREKLLMLMLNTGSKHPQQISHA